MKTTKTSIAKKITSVIIAAAAAMTAVAAATLPMASAATYYYNDGTIYHDGVNDGRIFQEDTYGNMQQQTYIGNDTFNGSIYYSADIGFYSLNGDTINLLGWDYTVTILTGRDHLNRKIYYNEDVGYFYLQRENYVPLGFDSSVIY